MIGTNIPLTDKFIEAYPPYKVRYMQLDPKSLIEYKLTINKICNRISYDYNQLIGIITEIKPMLNDRHFVEMLLNKLIDQGRVLVSNHLNSYKPISILMSKLYEHNSQILDVYVRLIIRKECKITEINGIYSIYFGVLVLLKDYERAWFILVSILNIEPNQYTGHVLEYYFLICSPLLETKKKRLFKLKKYLNDFFYPKISNIAIETRIREYLNKI
ncbi:hypothetical protein A0H76_1574 [Hepatospora eriocheir]|uniref:Uncharacterized protein n=1 Tax=Hepatospora eriocheir TaxID=1081669 RepID=A0A1X0QGW4_9MICR|nr:hypothetical protein A0H76_1574 [Hepatospora eriocheir]